MNFSEQNGGLKTFSTISAEIHVYADFIFCFLIYVCHIFSEFSMPLPYYTEFITSNNTNGTFVQTLVIVVWYCVTTKLYKQDILFSVYFWCIITQFMASIWNRISNRIFYGFPLQHRVVLNVEWSAQILLFIRRHRMSLKYQSFSHFFYRATHTHTKL